jgi:hypothetical protein
MTVSEKERTKPVKHSFTLVEHVASLEMEPSRRNRDGSAAAHASASARPRRTDAKLRAQTDMILALPVVERLRQLEVEAAFFASLRPLDD